MKRSSVIVLGVIAVAVVLAATRTHWLPLISERTAVSELPEATEVSWADLIPDDFVQPENPFIKMSQEEIDKLMDGSDESNAEMARLQEEFNYAPVVPGLDGRRIKIPAYITPLEYNGESKLKEFLLVPYVGACMHTPPPPANQIVHAESGKAITFSDMSEPVWAVGTIRTQSVKSDLAESGYKLDVESVVPYY